MGEAGEEGGEKDEEADSRDQRLASVWLILTLSISLTLILTLALTLILTSKPKPKPNPNPNPNQLWAALWDAEYRAAMPKEQAVVGELDSPGSLVRVTVRVGVRVRVT